MAVSQNVIQFVNHIEQGRKEANTFRWSDLTAEEKEYLFDQAGNRWADDKKGVELLQSVYRILDTDIPNKVKVLQLVYVRRDTSPDLKKKLLNNIKKELENLRVNAKDARQFNLYSGDYHLLLARSKDETGNLERTLAEYQAAINYYEKAGANERNTQVKREVEKLKARKDQKNNPLPIDLLISQRSQVEAELSKAEKKFTQVKIETQKSLQYLGELEQKQKDRQGACEEKQAQLKNLNTEIETLQEKYPSVGAILEFMLALPQAATAPLWVEVVRLALQQGEMDDFSRKALERLAIPYPQEAIPLLAEIAARAPEPFKIEKHRAQTGMTQWLLLIAQARQEMQAKKQLKAAETMVKAWEIFFTLQPKN
jgi:hypothetical protein